MIVRGVLNGIPEYFDFFNDYWDTRRWLLCKLASLERDTSEWDKVDQLLCDFYVRHATWERESAVRSPRWYPTGGTS